MKKLLKKALLFTLCMISFPVLGSNLYAESGEDKSFNITRNESTVTIYGDITNHEAIDKAVTKYLADPSVVNVKVIDKKYTTHTKYDSSSKDSLYGWNVKDIGCAIPYEQIREVPHTVVGAFADVEVTMKDINPVPNAFHGSFGAPNNLIRASLGFDVTDTTNFPLTYTYKIPSDVKQMKVYTYPIDLVSTYSVYYNKIKKGSGKARKVIGVNHVKSFE